MEQQGQRSSILSIGLVGGLGSIIVLIILNISSPAALMDYGLSSLILPSLAGIIATLVQKKRQSSYLNFGQGVSTSILVFALGNFISTIFLILLETVFEPGLPLKFISIQKERLNAKFISNGINKADFDRQMEALNQFHGASEIIKSSILSFFLFTIFALIIFIISSSIIKDERLNRS